MTVDTGPSLTLDEEALTSLPDARRPVHVYEGLRRLLWATFPELALTGLEVTPKPGGAPKVTYAAVHRTPEEQEAAHRRSPPAWAHRAP